MEKFPLSSQLKFLCLFLVFFISSRVLFMDDTNSNTLTFTLTFDNYIAGSTTVPDMIVATDESLSKTLSYDSSQEVKPGTYSYSYYYKKLPTDLYVSPPSFLVTNSLEPPALIPLESASGDGISERIRNAVLPTASIRELDTDVYKIEISLLANPEIMPTKIRLSIGNDTVKPNTGVQTAFSYNPQDGFEEKKLSFLYHADNGGQGAITEEDIVLAIDEYVQINRDSACKMISNHPDVNVHIKE